MCASMLIEIESAADLYLRLGLVCALDNSDISICRCKSSRLRDAEQLELSDVSKVCLACMHLIDATVIRINNIVNCFKSGTFPSNI